MKEPDPFAPVDIEARHLTMATRVELRVHSMGGYLLAELTVDGRIIATGVGRTLGEALMVAGALMTATPIMPMHKRILRRLARLR